MSKILSILHYMEELVCDCRIASVWGRSGDASQVSVADSRYQAPTMAGGPTLHLAFPKLNQFPLPYPLPLVQCLSVTTSGRNLAVSIIPTF